MAAHLAPEPIAAMRQLMAAGAIKEMDGSSYLIRHGVATKFGNGPGVR